MAQLPIIGEVTPGNIALGIGAACVAGTTVRLKGAAQRTLFPLVVAVLATYVASKAFPSSPPSPTPAQQP